jgi:hypothetical protein
MKARMVASSLVLGTLIATPALADDAHAPIADVAVRGGVAGSSTFFVPFGAMLGAEAHYHVTQRLLIGGYLHYATVTSTSSDHHDYEGEEFSATRFGPRFELHLLPDGVVDPLLAVAAGAYRAVDVRPISEAGEEVVWGMDLSADLGVDFHVSSSIRLGVMWTVVIPTTSTDVYGGDGFGGGTYYSALSRIPIPLLRAAVAF